MTENGGLRIGIFVFDGAEELDVVGPFQVFAEWGSHSRMRPSVSTFSWDGSGVRLAKGLRILPVVRRGRRRAAARPGLPGRALNPAPAGPGRSPGVAAPDPQADLDHGQRLHGRPAAGGAGLLAGRPATTHHNHYDELSDLDPSILVDTEARYVDDGDVITSAGVAAGIDMALHLVERLETPAVARSVRFEIQHVEG